MALFIEGPSQNNLDLWRKINVLIAPLGIRDIDYGPTTSIEYHKELCFKEGWTGCPTLQINAFKNFKQDNRTQYGLKYRVAGTIHSGDTLLSMATEISSMNSNFSLWDKGNSSSFSAELSLLKI